MIKIKRSMASVFGWLIPAAVLSSIQRRPRPEGNANGIGILSLKLAGWLGFFSFLYLKKIKISKIYGGFEKIQNYTPVAPCLGDRGPVALGPGARDALNSELVK